MAIPKITGAQRDFSAGELDDSMKRADENPVLKIGARQALNWRILSSGAARNRPGRRALFLETGRVEEVLMSPGNIFFLVFGAGYLRVYNSAGTRVFSSTVKGDGSTPVSWTAATAKNVSFVVAPGSLAAIYIAYADGAPNNPPQVLTWDGVSQTSVWTLTTFSETFTLGGQKRTIFSRISPQNITMVPSGQIGAVTITFSAPVLVPGMVGARMTWCGQQIVIQGVISPTVGIGGIMQYLPGGQSFVFSGNILSQFSVGDEVTGSITGALGIVTGISEFNLNVQVIPSSSGGIIYFAAVAEETIVGPQGSALPAGISPIPPSAVAIWDDEVMNTFRGYPSSVFYDQGRLGFCNFPSLPAGIGWSAIGLPSDFFVSDVAGITPDSAMFELAPGKSQVFYVLPGMESSEFVFCDNAIYYIPISATSPLKPGSVGFTALSEQGCLPNVMPQPVEQSILYVRAGGAQLGAVQAPGAYYRPYVVDPVSEFHSHLFTASLPIAIAVPDSSVQFEELYAYILLANGNVVVGKYATRQGLLDVGPDGKPKIGWLSWNGAGKVGWISAQGADVVFTTNYPTSTGGFSDGFSAGFGGAVSVSVVEVLDNTQYLDGAMLVNAAPAPFAPAAGQGPLWWLAGGSVDLMDQSTRSMGTYQIDASGFIVPQNNGGEDLTAATLVAGQGWTAILEPFVPDAPPGQSAHQRMFKRRVARMAVYVKNSTGFLLARLFSGPITRTSPPLGTVMNTRRVTTWNQDDDPTQAPPLREEVQRWRPLGRAFDPRVAIIKDTPGPIEILELGTEVTI